MDGSFSSRAEVSHTTEDVTWTDARGQTHTGTAYTVVVEDPDLDQVSYTVHYRLPDPGMDQHFTSHVEVHELNAADQPPYEDSCRELERRGVCLLYTSLPIILRSL